MSELTVDEVPKLKVVELKNELEARGLSKAGKKDELISRLVDYIESHNEKGSAESEEDTTVTKEEKDDEDLKLQEEKSKAKEEEELKVQEEENKKKEELLREKEEEDHRLKEEEEQKAKAEQKIKEEQRKEEENKKEEKEKERKKKEEEEQREEEEQKKRKEKREEERRKEEEQRRKEDKEKRRKEEEKKREEEKRRKRKEEEREEEKRKDREDRKKEDEVMREERKRKDEDRKKKEKEHMREDEHQRNDEKNKSKADKDNKEASGETDKCREDRSEEKAVEGKESRFGVTGDDDGNNDNIKGKVEICSRNVNVPENGITSKEETTDDTLVMEIDQNDMVPEDPAKEEGSKQEEIISAEPGQITSLRKLGGSKGSDPERKKRGWGASRSNRPSSTDDVEISSNSLKDLVPDLKPLLSNEAVMEEAAEAVDSDADVAGPKIPDKAKKDGEPIRKRKKIHMEDLTETNIILIVNLTRPFTVNQLKEMLKRTGTIEDFWIDRIKSKCCAKFSSVDQASETRMALDGVTWPQGNPKTLRVSFASEEAMTNMKEGSNEVSGRLGSDGSGRLGDVREWDRNKKDQEKEREMTRIKREVKVDKEEKVEDTETEKKLAGKSLEDLFKKTVAVPAVYWKPLSEEEQKKKEEERNKKVMEAQIMREMMDTKESLQRSKRLVPVRRRSRSSSGSSH